MKKIIKNLVVIWLWLILDIFGKKIDVVQIYDYVIKNIQKTNMAESVIIKQFNKL